jgi:hypothetical protein
LVWQRTDFLWDGDVLLGESAAHAPDAPSPDPLAQLRRSYGADVIVGSYQANYRNSA